MRRSLLTLAFPALALECEQEVTEAMQSIATVQAQPGRLCYARRP